MMLALVLAAQVAAPPSAYLEQSDSLARDSVISGFCYSIGWEPDPTANVWFEAELDRLALAHGVAAGLARETALRQALDFSQGLRAEMTAPRGDAVEQTKFLDGLEIWVRQYCPEVAQRRPALFKGDLAVNQARVDRNFVEFRRQASAPATAQ